MKKIMVLFMAILLIGVFDTYACGHRPWYGNRRGMTFCAVRNCGNYYGMHPAMRPRMWAPPLRNTQINIFGAQHGYYETGRYRSLNRSLRRPMGRTWNRFPARRTHISMHMRRNIGNVGWW